MASSGGVTAVRGIRMFDVNEAASPHCGKLRKCHMERVVRVV